MRSIVISASHFISSSLLTCCLLQSPYMLFPQISLHAVSSSLLTYCLLQSPYMLSPPVSLHIVSSSLLACCLLQSPYMLSTPVSLHVVSSSLLTCSQTFLQYSGVMLSNASNTSCLMFNNDVDVRLHIPNISKSKVPHFATFISCSCTESYATYINLKLIVHGSEHYRSCFENW